MKLGLVLGGGGVVGVAWEIGVLAGLAHHTGFDPAGSAVIAGISAGSIVGTRVALGHDLDDLVAEQRASLRGAMSPGRRPPARDGLSVVPDEIMAVITSNEGTLEERSAAVGRLAMDADVALDERAFIDAIGALTHAADWPESDLRITTVDCQTGSTVLWSRADRIELVRAVASSCAVPGWFPTVKHEGRHYTDAPRGEFCTSLAATADLDALVFIGPYITHDPGMGDFPELRRLSEAGLKVVEIRGANHFAEVADDLMDPARRARAVDVGLEDGAASAASIRSLMGEAVPEEPSTTRPVASEGTP